MKPSKPTREQKAQIMNEKNFPTVEFGMWGFKDQAPNRTGAKTGQLYSGERALHIFVPNKISKDRFAVMELTEKLIDEDGVEEEEDIVVYPHTKFEDFFFGMFGCYPYEEGKRGSTRLRKKVGVKVPPLLQGMVDPKATSEYKQARRAKRVAENMGGQSSDDDEEVKKPAAKKKKTRASIWEVKHVPAIVGSIIECAGLLSLLLLCYDDWVSKQSAQWPWSFIESCYFYCGSFRCCYLYPHNNYNVASKIMIACRVS